MTGPGGNVLGVRLARNAPVLFVDGGGAQVRPGDRVVIELAGDGEREAIVSIGTGQMLLASVGALAGRVVRLAGGREGGAPVKARPEGS